jgi:hypothetical protein
MNVLQARVSMFAGIMALSIIASAELQNVEIGCRLGSSDVRHGIFHMTDDAGYTVTTGGTMDMDNTMTREHGCWKIGFQNNLLLRIENTGEVPVENPRIVINSQRDWHDWQSILAEFTRGAQNDQEKVYLIYDGLRNNRHHDYPLFGDNEYHDPVRFLNIYGGGFCDDSGMVGSALYHLAGFNKENGGQDPFVRALHGHMMCEVWHDGDFQFMDIDQDTFYLDRENRKPVSGDTVAQDHEYALREQVYGPQFQPWDKGPYTAASLFGADDERAGHGVWGQEMNYTLRPGESMEFRWDNAGKRPYQAYDNEHRYYGNSFLRYNPPLDALLQQPGVEAAGLLVDDGWLTVGEDDALLSITLETCYTICGGESVLAYEASPPDSKLLLEVECRGEVQAQPETKLWGERSLRLDLESLVPFHDAPPAKSYTLRYRFESAKGLVIDGLRIDTVLYASPIALPRLRVGENAVQYSDETAQPHDVLVRHEWRESREFSPPKPPLTPTAPEDGAAVASTLVPFAWPAVDGCDAYHLMVSRDPDMRYAYRPNYDLILNTNEYQVPHSGMFTPGEAYYWRVRPRLAQGLWGDWSTTWTFTWEGPMVPRDVRVEQEGDDLWLTWQPNPGGSRPVRYDIYGSDIRGFLTSREPRKMPVIGEVEGSFVLSAEDTRLLIGGANANFPGANRAYYRVVAVDAAGTESCPSDYAEFPRPHIINLPPPARVGEIYSHQFVSIHSRGDLQSRYDGLGLWEEETYQYSLIDGPSWLNLSPQGLLKGIPLEKISAVHISVGIDAVLAGEVSPDSEKSEVFRKATTVPKHPATQTFSFGVLE